ncbi:MAG: hypothetical protein ACREEM_27670 [Blastocatellia bacterium]
MTKQVLKMFSMLSLAVALAAVAVHANPANPASPPLKANIPFDFSVGNKTLPAGVYTVTPLTTPGALRIRREDCRAAALVQTQSVQARHDQDQTKLVFRRYGDQYFLAQVWTAGESDVRELQKSRTERELVKNSSKYLTMDAVKPEIVCIVAE